MVTVKLAPDRKGVQLRVDADTDILDLVRSIVDPYVPRGTRTGTYLPFRVASALLNQPALPLTWDLAARRAVENRARVEEVAPDVLAEMRRLQSVPMDEIRARIADSHLAHLLDDHQARNVACMTVRDGWGACIFDEQGTGKTPTAVATFDLLVERGEADLLLIVAPKSMIAEWESEFLRFAGSLYGVAVAHGTTRDRVRALESGNDVMVINYESAIGLADNLRLLAQRGRVVLVIDESFAVKNPDARRTGALRDLREWCTRAFVLCGTPAPNSARDVVSQFDLVDFGRTFENLTLDADPRAAAIQVRAAMYQRGVFTRNLKRTVLPHLPSRTFTEVAVTMAPVQHAVYESTLVGLIDELESVTDLEFQRQAGAYLQRRSALLRICSNPAPLVPDYQETPAKLDALDRLLEELIEVRGEKVVVWSFYRASLDAIASRYKRYGLSRIDGDVDVAGRRDAVRRFQDDEDTMLFVGNPAAGGAGITLHRGRVAVYESLSGQAAHYLQSLDRIHRRGQDRPVEYVTLLCSGTIEEHEYSRLLQKADAQADLLGDPPLDRPTRELFLTELVDAKRLLDGASHVRTK